MDSVKFRLFLNLTPMVSHHTALDIQTSLTNRAVVAFFVQMYSESELQTCPGSEQLWRSDGSSLDAQSGKFEFAKLLTVCLTVSL